MVFGKGYPYDGAEKVFSTESFSECPYIDTVYRGTDPSKFLMADGLSTEKNVSSMGKNGFFFVSD